MKKPPIISQPTPSPQACVTHKLRENIRAQLAHIDANLSEMNDAEIERRAKALSALFKLVQTIDEDFAAREAHALQHADKAHTPYDQLPPPTEDEMREIRARLNRRYDRLRTALAATSLTRDKPPK
jgi:uncharacterized membrane protein YccC